MPAIINTRADLDALKGTSAYTDALKKLKASMTTQVDEAVYPAGYGEAGYIGPAVAPSWTAVETLDTIERLGFTKDDFLAACTAAGI